MRVIQNILSTVIELIKIITPTITIKKGSKSLAWKKISYKKFKTWTGVHRCFIVSYKGHAYRVKLLDRKIDGFDNTYFTLLEIKKMTKYPLDIVHRKRKNPSKYNKCET